eukprot:g18352.t1
MRYSDWFSRFEPGTDGDGKKQFLLDLLAEPASEVLVDPPPISAGKMAWHVSRQKGYFEKVKAYKRGKRKTVDVEF